MGEYLENKLLGFTLPLEKNRDSSQRSVWGQNLGVAVFWFCIFLGMEHCKVHEFLMVTWNDSQQKHDLLWFAKNWFRPWSWIPFADWTAKALSFWLKQGWWVVEREGGYLKGFGKGRRITEGQLISCGDTDVISSYFHIYIYIHTHDIGIF